MNNPIDLLEKAAFEIKRLRTQNELMNARLDMFDKCMMLLRTNTHYQGTVGNEVWNDDLIFSIEKYIDTEKTVHTVKS